MLFIHQSFKKDTKMDAMELNSRYRPEMTHEGIAELCQQILVSSVQVPLAIYCAKKAGWWKEPLV